MVVLAIHAAVNDISLALWIEEEIISKTFPGPTAKAEDLPIFISEFLEENSLNIDQISEVVVAIGYGAFTGLRLSLVVAKALALEKDISLIAVPTMSAFASEVIKEKSLSKFILSIYACRGESNVVIYDEGEQVGSDLILNQIELENLLQKHPESTLVTEQDISPSAKGLLYVRSQFKKLTQREELVSLKPVYSHSARIQKSKKKELQHLKALRDV